MQVLQQRVAQQVLVGGLPDDRRDRRQPGLTRGTRATLPHDELVFALVVETDDDRLQHSELADAVHQLREIVGIEVRARLAGVGNDVVRVDRDQSRPRHRHELGFVTHGGCRGIRVCDTGDLCIARLDGRGLSRGR